MVLPSAFAFERVADAAVGAIRKRSVRLTSLETCRV